LRPQRLEGCAIVPLERREAFKHLCRENGAGIGDGPFEETVQRVANLLDGGDGSANCVFAVII
jgi:hypothetical protein